MIKFVLTLGITIGIIVTFVALFVQGVYLSRSTTQSPTNNKIKLVIDHDGGADDAMAIFMAFESQKYLNGPQVIALMTTHGNVDEPMAFKNSQKFLSMVNETNTPIYRGASKSIVKDYPSDAYFGLDGLGDSEHEFEYQKIEAQPEPAAVGLIELSKKYEGQLVVICLGSMTNIALAVTIDQGFLSRLSQLVIGGGTIHSELYPEPEFNAMQDVEAYYSAVRAARSHSDKVTVLPFSQVYQSLNISMDWRINVLGSIPTKIVQAMNRFEKVVWAKSDQFVYLDPAVTTAVLNPNFIDETKKSNNSIILCGTDRGINTNVLEDSTSNVELIYSMNIDLYKEFLLNVFSASLKSNNNK